MNHSKCEGVTCGAITTNRCTVLQENMAEFFQTAPTVKPQADITTPTAPDSKVKTITKKVSHQKRLYNYIIIT